jgi:hypothetical protein
VEGKMKSRFTAPQITELNNNSSSQHIRPKRKRNHLSAPSLSSRSTSSFVLSKPRALCNNPLDRLSELLLNWNILNESGEQDQVEKLPSVPDVFESYKQYISVWEPLFIHETKASIYSSLSLDENYGKCRAMPLNYEEKNTPVIKIQVNFGTESSNSRFLNIFSFSIYL